MDRVIYFFCMCASINFSFAEALVISSEPIAIFYTPDSIIDHTPPEYFQQVGERSRLSTCTGVAWFADSKHLISANLLESSLQTYRFKPAKKKIYLEKKMNKEITLLGWPENLSTNHQKKLLAISNSYNGTLNIYKLESKNGKLTPSPITQIYAGDNGLHGVRFSPDGKYLGYVTYDGLGKIRLFRVISNINGTPLFELSSTMDSTFENLAPKGLDFSHDLQYIAICYSSKIRSESSEISGKLAIFKFDAEKGTIGPDPISEIGTESFLDTPEDLLFSSDDSCLLVSNQRNDTISIHEFDTAAGYVYNSYVALKTPEGQLNFPHGISISPDGKYLAVSNYGDDKICIYKIESNSH